MKINKQPLSWNRLFLLTFLAVYLYVFSEWLFAATKPSYLNTLTFSKQIQIFLSISAIVAGLCLLGLLGLFILGQLPPLKRFSSFFALLGGWLPAVILAVLVLLLVDNFTYTLFQFGIVSTSGWSRALYGLAFLLLMILAYWWVMKMIARQSEQTRILSLRPQWLLALLVGVLLVSLAVLVFPYRPRLSQRAIAGAEAAQRPHILLITSDGVNAEHMSVYGYNRETTPHLKALAETALLAENAFTNSGQTTGSVISIYTGKYPAKTRLLYAPDILQGEDSSQHLPGILRAYGYKTIQITLPHFLDANELNVRDGFDEVKTEVKTYGASHSKYMNAIRKILPFDQALFADEVVKRVMDRVRHVLFIKEMTNPYLLVTRMSDPFSDVDRLETLEQEILSANQPLFVHIHLMGTHGDTFDLKAQHFSAGKSIEAQEPWDVDFYDDSILEMDANIGELVATLKRVGLFDKTVFIIGSDHGQGWDSLKRIPLIIRFPSGQHAGRLQSNAQNLDIAPTLLDYLGMDQPAWMPGRSLIAGVLEQRPIFGVTAIKTEQAATGDWVVSSERAVAPFYQFGSINLIYCQKWYRLDLNPIGWDSGNVAGSTAPACDSTDEQAFQWMVEHLRENSFDVSTLNQIP